MTYFRFLFHSHSFCDISDSWKAYVNKGHCIWFVSCTVIENSDHINIAVFPTSSAFFFRVLWVFHRGRAGCPLIRGAAVQYQFYSECVVGQDTDPRIAPESIALKCECFCEWVLLAVGNLGCTYTRPSILCPCMFDSQHLICLTSVSAPYWVQSWFISLALSLSMVQLCKQAKGTKA